MAKPVVSPGLPSEDRFAAELRGFGAVGVVAILVILLLGGYPWTRGLLALLWAYRSRTPWREIGYVRPRSWIGSLALGLLFGSAFKLLMKAVVMPFLGADPINHAYHYLVGNRAALPVILFMLTVNAGFGEETVFRGYMFERLGKLLGRGVGATIAIVLLTTAWFALLHYPDQGLAGAEQAIFTGLVFGTIFAVTGRLWFLMVAHAAFDLTALAIIYWDVEFKVAHFLFG
jgi:membrane protease YdiL (CAAX protease family)